MEIILKGQYKKVSMISWTMQANAWTSISTILELNTSLPPLTTKE